MITILHEFIIHVFFGYLNFISDRELPSSSPKKGNNISNEDGGLLFENLLFGKIFGTIYVNDIITILNGEKINSIELFKQSLGNKFNIDSFHPNSELMKSILKEYPINFEKLKNREIYSCMKAKIQGICIDRGIVLKPYSIFNS